MRPSCVARRRTGRSWVPGWAVTIPRSNSRRATTPGMLGKFFSRRTYVSRPFVVTTSGYTVCTRKSTMTSSTSAHRTGAFPGWRPFWDVLFVSVRQAAGVSPAVRIPAAYRVRLALCRTTRGSDVSWNSHRTCWTLPRDAFPSVRRCCGGPAMPPTTRFFRFFARGASGPWTSPPHHPCLVRHACGRGISQQGMDGPHGGLLPGGCCGDSQSAAVC